MKTLTIILAGLFALIAAPAAAQTLDDHESDHVVYVNPTTDEIWAAMIFKAASTSEAKTLVSEIDESTLEDNMPGFVEIAIELDPTPDSEAREIGFTRVQGFGISGDHGEGLIIVASAGEYVYTFVAVGDVDMDEFAPWTAEIVQDEELPNRAPAGFTEAKG